MEPLRLTWRDRLRSWATRKVFRVMGIRSGPYMIYGRGCWYYIDFKGDIYQLTPSGDYEWCPLNITLLHRA